MRSSSSAFALFFALCSASALALDVSSPLEKAISHYEEGSFAVAKQAFAEVIASPGSTLEERGRARTYLAATLLGLQDRPQARRTLVELFEEDPQATIDPLVFPPELLVIAEQSRAEVKIARSARLSSPDAGAPGSAPAPAVVAEGNPTAPGASTPAAEVAGPPPGGGSTKRYALIPAVVGGAALVGSAVAYLQARSIHSELTVQGRFRDQAHVDEVAGSGRSAQTVSGVLLGVGVAALGAAGGMVLLGGDGEAVAVGVDFRSAGAGVGLSGGF